MEIEDHQDVSQAVGSSSSMGGSYEKELFVVQRCWFSGPQQYQPLDFLRLFLHQRDAEEAAYHSAHAWCRFHNPTAEPQVRTLLLPSYPSHNKAGSSYGFIAHGSMFWVRSLVATVLGGQNHHLEAHAVLTEGVIGGTGNRNSRRGTEIPIGRVFVGAAATRFQALNVCHQVMAQLKGPSINVHSLPVGKPSEYQSGEFLKDWPPQVLQPNLLESNINNEHKRQYRSTDNQHLPLPQHPSQLEQGVLVVECPFEMPAAKKRRFFKMEDQPATVSPMSVPGDVMGDDDAMMSFGVMGEQA